MLPGGTDKVEAASHSCGIKDATVALIISHITARGKALRGSKSLNADASQNSTGKPTTQDSTNVNADDINDLVRYLVLRNPRALILLQGPTAIAGDNSYQETTTSDSTLEFASMPLREDAQRLTEPKIQAKLTEELGALLKQRGMNPLLGMPGMICVKVVALMCDLHELLVGEPKGVL